MTTYIKYKMKCFLRMRIHFLANCFKNLTFPSIHLYVHSFAHSVLRWGTSSSGRKTPWPLGAVCEVECRGGLGKTCTSDCLGTDPCNSTRCLRSPPGHLIEQRNTQMKALHIKSVSILRVYESKAFLLLIVSCNTLNFLLVIQKCSF